MNELLNHPYLTALLIFWTAAALATIHGGKPAEKAFEMAATCTVLLGMLYCLTFLVTHSR